MKKLPKHFGELKISKKVIKFGDKFEKLKRIIKLKDKKENTNAENKV